MRQIHTSTARIAKDASKSTPRARRQGQLVKRNGKRAEKGHEAHSTRPALKIDEHMPHPHECGWKFTVLEAGKLCVRCAVLLSRISLRASTKNTFTQSQIFLQPPVLSPTASSKTLGSIGTCFVAGFASIGWGLTVWYAAPSYSTSTAPRYDFPSLECKM